MCWYFTPLLRKKREMDQRSGMKGSFPTTKKIKWTQPRTTQPRKVGASNTQHNAPLPGVAHSEKGRPGHPHVENVVKPMQPSRNTQHWTQRFSRPSGLSKTRQLSTTLNPISKTTTSKPKSLYLMPRQSVDLTASRTHLTRDGGTPLNPARKPARDGTTATTQAPIVVVPETPDGHQHHSRYTSRSRAYNPAVTADLVVPETPPAVETPAIGVFSAKGELSGGGSESTEDGDRSESPDLLCSFRLSSIPQSREPKILAGAYEHSVRASLRKRARQEQSVPHLQHPCSKFVDSGQTDRYSPPPPGGRTNPRLFHHQGTQIGKEDDLRPNEANRRVDGQPRAQEAANRSSFCPNEGAQASEMAANDVPKCSLRSLPREDDEARVVERERGVERCPPVNGLSSAVASVGQARNHQAGSLEKGVTRLDVAPGFTVDSNAGAGARSRLKAGITVSSGRGRMTPGELTTYPAAATTRVGRDAKPGFTRPHVSSSVRLRPSTATSAMAGDKSSPMVPGSSNTADCVHTNGTVASVRRTEPTSISQSPSTVPAVRPTAITVSANTPNSSFSTSQEQPRSTQRLSHGCGSPKDGDWTPPEKIFARAHQRVFKSSSGRGRDVVGRKRGRGRGGFAAGRGGKGRHNAPVAAQGPVTGGWRTERGKKW